LKVFSPWPPLMTALMRRLSPRRTQQYSSCWLNVAWRTLS